MQLKEHLFIIDTNFYYKLIGKNFLSLKKNEKSLKAVKKEKSIKSSNISLSLKLKLETNRSCSI